MEPIVFVNSGLTGVGAEQHGQPGYGSGVIFPPVADVADPGREIGYGDQFIAQPGEIGNEAHMHHSSLAFSTGDRLW